MIFVGDDWAEDHHDIHVMSADGTRLASRRLPEGLAGISGFHEMVASHAQAPADVVVGIETDRGLWVSALLAAGYTVYAVNPLAAARYRDRHHLSGAKSDTGDAKLLADLVRTDRHNHRTIAGDSADADAIKVLALCRLPRRGSAPERRGDPGSVEKVWETTQYRIPRPGNPEGVAYRTSHSTAGGHHCVRCHHPIGGGVDRGVEPSDRRPRSRIDPPF